MAAERGAFDPSVYVERKSLEDGVVTACRAWFDGRARAGWIALKSTSGQGNTWLLHSLQRKISSEFVLRYIARTLLVSAAGVAGSPPEVLSPMQSALTRPLRTHFARLQSVAGTVFRPRILLGALGFVVALLLVNAAGNYFPDTPDATIAGFVTSYLPQRATVYFILLAATALVGGFGQLLKRALQAPGSELTDVEKRDLITADALVKGLRRHAGSRRVLIVIVDRSLLLPLSDRRFINDFLIDRRDPAISALLATHRVLFVTMDEVDDWLPDRTPSSQHRVDPLTDEALLEIARRQYPELHARLKEDDPDARETIEEAKANIHALSAEEGRLEREAGDAFFAAQQRNPDPGAFAVESLMVYEAVRVMAAIGTTTPLKEQLREWLTQEATVNHLALFGVRPPGDPTAILGDLGESRSIAQFLPRRVSFDLTRCRAMVEWARKSASEKHLAARAYYFWLSDLLGEVSDADVDKAFSAVPPVRRRHAIKKAAWLAMELGEFSEPEDLVAGMKPEDERAVRRRMVVALLLAAVVYAREGESRMTTSALEELAEWLDGPMLPHAPKLVESAVASTWEMFWLTADPVLRRSLQRIAEKLPAITARQSWRIESRFEDLVSARMPEPWKPRTQVKLSAALHDRAQLTESLRRLRARRGFLFGIFDDEPWPEIGVASGRHFPGATATALRGLSVAAVIGTPRAQEIIETWTGAARSEVAASCVGDESLVAYEQGALAHARFRVLLATDAAAAVKAAREGVSAYERSLMLASLVSWRGLTAEVSYHFGALLTELAAVEQRTARSDWEAWEIVFQSALDIEQDQRWMLFTPDIHKLRWDVFRRMAVETSLEDGYNAYVTAKTANLPQRVVVRLNALLRVDFTNGGDTDTDQQRAAQLHEEWAELAALDEAREFWTHPSLELEQADAMSFAAQAKRNLGNYDEAAALLDRAEAMLPAGEADAEILESARELRSSIEFQRISIYSDQGHVGQADAATRKLWGTLRVGDEIYPLILIRMVSSDARRKLLGEPWPLVNGEYAPDPDAPDLSVDAEAITRAGGVEIANHYQYRFWQLFQHLLTMKRESLEFRPAIISIATTGLEYSSFGRGSVTPALVRLLEHARQESARLHYESAEIEALRLLFIATDDARYRSQYVSATLAYTQLLDRERELAVRIPLGWYQLAERIHHYLSVMIDKRLMSEDFTRTLVQHGAEPDAFYEAQKVRTQSYAAAARAYGDGERAKCISILDGALPPATSPWVFWEDLRAINQWLACNAAVAPDSAERSARIQQLRAFTMRYVQQLARTIADAEGHLLGMKLQRVVEEALKDSVRIPIGAGPSAEPTRKEGPRASRPQLRV